MKWTTLIKKINPIEDLRKHLQGNITTPSRDSIELPTWVKTLLEARSRMPELKRITFANGDHFLSLSATGFKVRAIKDLPSADWKTSAIHGSRHLLKNEEMVVDEIFINIYGLYLQGSNPRGQLVSLRPDDLHLFSETL